MTPLAEKVHSLFRGANEVSKTAKFVALLMDLCSAGIAIAGIFGTWKSSWVPLVLLGAAVVSALFRSYAAGVRGFAQRCRRSSLRAFCSGRDVDQITESNMAIDAPAGSLWMAKRVPAQSMVEYYEPISSEGELRLRELYAHSAFYTWRLLQMYFKIAAAWSIAIFFLSFTIFYRLAQTPSGVENRNAIIDALCSVALVLLCVRAVEGAIAAKSSADDAKQIEANLTRRPLGVDLLEIADAYDIERAAGAEIPTQLYLSMRNCLQTQWHARRNGII